VNLETKFEYQLPLELAEKLAIEQAAIQIESFRGKHWHLPTIIGVFVSVLFLSGDGKCQIGGNDYPTIGRTITALVGFVLGFGGTWLLLYFIRTNLRVRIKEQNRKAQAKLGTTRLVTWDQEWLKVSMPARKLEYKWQLIDEIKIEPIGIHLLSGGHNIFSIPRAALPSNIDADDLIKNWQKHIARPPVLL
jgi:hypothetical protein